MSQAPALSIGEVAARSGVRSSAIRYYEAIGVLPVPERVSGRRRYDERVLLRLAAIDCAKRAGFTLGEVRLLVGEASQEAPLSERWRELAADKLGEVDALIERAEAMRGLLLRGLECSCVGPEDCRLLDFAGDVPDRSVHAGARAPSTRRPQE